MPFAFCGSRTNAINLRLPAMGSSPPAAVVAQRRLQRIIFNTVGPPNAQPQISESNNAACSSCFSHNSSFSSQVGDPILGSSQFQMGEIESSKKPAIKDGENAIGMRCSSSRQLRRQTQPTSCSCIFCDIIQDKAPAFKLYEDETCLCILDINPLSYGHSLLIPKTHFTSLETTPPQPIMPLKHLLQPLLPLNAAVSQGHFSGLQPDFLVAAAMCQLVPLISKVLMEATDCDAFNLVVNSGAAAGQVVFHTHFHIIPRRPGDGLWTSENVSRRTLSAFKDPSQLMQIVKSKLFNKI